MDRNERLAAIKRKVRAGISLSAIAREMGTSKQNISALLLREKKNAEAHGLGDHGSGISSEDVEAARLLAINYDRCIEILDGLHEKLKATPNKENSSLLIKTISELRLLSEARARHLKVLSSIESVAMFQKNITRIMREVLDEKTITEIGKRLREAR